MCPHPGKKLLLMRKGYFLKPSRTLGGGATPSEQRAAAFADEPSPAPPTWGDGANRQRIPHYVSARVVPGV